MDGYNMYMPAPPAMPILPSILPDSHVFSNVMLFILHVNYRTLA